jgi:hypothetical protein
MHRSKKTDAVTWKSYDWSKHNAMHYINDTEHLFGALLITVDGSKLGLIRIPGLPRWHLPFGTHVRDEENNTDAAARSFYMNFYEDAIEEIVSHSQDTGFVIQDDPILKTKLQIEWTLDDLNEHIRVCIRDNKRPFWNKPGQITRCTTYFRVNVSERDIDKLPGCVNDKVVDELKFFTYEDVVALAPDEMDNVTRAHILDMLFAESDDESDDDSDDDSDDENTLAANNARAIVTVVICIAAILISVILMFTDSTDDAYPGELYENYNYHMYTRRY